MRLAAAAALAGALLLVPVPASADPQEEFLPAIHMTVEDTACAAAEGQVPGIVDGTLWLPHDGCSAVFDIGGLEASAFMVVGAEWRMEGDLSSVCGYLEFSGAAVGTSAMGCVDGNVVTSVQPQARTQPTGEDLLRVTWRPLSYEGDDLYLCSLELTYDGKPLGWGDPDCFGVAAEPHPACHQVWAVADQDGSALLTFPADDLAHGYRVLQRTVLPEPTGYEVVAEIDALQMEYRFTGLAPGVIYGFAVASLRHDDSGWSCTAFAQATGEQAEVPDFPTIVSWAAVAGVVGITAWAIAARGRRKQP